MGKKEKLEARLLSRPTDMTFEEVSTLFGYYGLSQRKTGEGRRVKGAVQQRRRKCCDHLPQAASSRNL